MELDGRTLLAKIQALPPGLQLEVIRFVNFLSQEKAAAAPAAEEPDFEVAFAEADTLMLLSVAKPEREFHDT